MIVEKIYQEYEKVALSRVLDTYINRCSLANRCIRYLGFKKLGVIGRLTARAYMMFLLGDMVELIIKDDILKVLRSNDNFEFTDKDLEIKIDLGDGVILTGHLDGLMRLKDNDKYGVVEIKSMSNYAFDEALEGKISEDYIVQASLYAYALNVDFIDFICYRKETSHILELIFWRDIESNVKVQYMAHEEKDYFVLNYPFDFSFIPKIRDKYKVLNSVLSIEDVLSIPIPYDFTLCSNCNGTGQKEYGKCRSCKGMGKKIDLQGFVQIGYPCSYCPYNVICYPNQIVEFDGLRPVIKVRL